MWFDPMSFDPRTFDPMSFDPGLFDPMSVNLSQESTDIPRKLSRENPVKMLTEIRDFLKNFQGKSLHWEIPWIKTKQRKGFGRVVDFLVIISQEYIRTNSEEFLVTHSEEFLITHSKEFS